MNLRDWRIKGLVQKFLSVVPAGAQVNDWLQATSGGLKNLEANISSKVTDWELMIDYLRKVDRTVDGQWLLEIGSGWYPTLPVCHILAGAKRVTTVDIVRHASEKLTFRMFGALETHLERIAACSNRSISAVREQYKKLGSALTMSEFFAVAGIEYRAPEDAAKLELPDKCLDIIYSNSVFEHVRPEFIDPVMREAHRVLKDGGLCLHAIACNDHYAFFDKSISFVHFLQFSEEEWRPWNNKLNYQNRLRAIDYTQAAQAAGFRIIHEARAVRPGSYEALKAMKIAPEFQRYSINDLATTTVDFVGKKT